MFTTNLSMTGCELPIARRTSGIFHTISPDDHKVDVILGIYGFHLLLRVNRIQVNVIPEISQGLDADHPAGPGVVGVI